jgi:Caffeine-induced death protein 2
MRDLDDKIIYALNISLPTESMAKRSSSTPEKNCKDLYEKLSEGRSERERIIQECINVTAEHVRNLKKQRDEDMNNTALEKKFKSEQRKVSD